jgi:CheY-like chemotaxis protein
MQIPELLLVDDRKDDHDLFRDALALSGLRVSLTYAFTVPEAVRQVTRPRPLSAGPFRCLMVVDLCIPGMDGMALFRIVRSVYPPAEVAIVVLSGSIKDSDQVACREFAIGDFMRKTEDRAELAHWIGSLSRFLPPG